MENASKALLMAGGMMIAIAVISVALYFYSSARGFANTSEDILSSSQIQSFNRFYTAYEKTNIRVVDALNILNRAIEDGLDTDMINSSNSNIKFQDGHYTVTDPQYYLNSASLTLGYDVEGKVNKVTIGG